MAETAKEQGVEIKELKLKLGNKELTLTIEEAKKLKKALEELFGKDVIREEHHHHDNYYPYRWYYQNTNTWDSKGVVYCGDTNALTLDCTADNASTTTGA